MTHKNSIWSIWNFLYPQYTIMILRVLFMCIYRVSTMSRRWKKGQAYDYDKENPNFRKKRNCQIHCKYCLKRSCIIHLTIICFLTHLWFWKKINSWWKTFWGCLFFHKKGVKILIKSGEGNYIYSPQKERRWSTLKKPRLGITDHFCKSGIGVHLVQQSNWHVLECHSALWERPV